MKTLSYIFTAGAAISAILAFLARFAFGGKVIILFRYYIQGVEICLLAAIIFALYHLIGAKEK
ncbi:MAG: hypothetical protein JXB26_09085 [Candidatus Aminicenantes bacterium]|nr:hypothetical protein [Candidatus Aminicenantes bacterium]